MIIKLRFPHTTVQVTLNRQMTHKFIDAFLHNAERPYGEPMLDVYREVRAEIIQMARMEHYKMDLRDCMDIGFDTKDVDIGVLSDAQIKDMSLDDAVIELKNKVYDACFLLKRLESQGRIIGADSKIDRVVTLATQILLESLWR